MITSEYPRALGVANIRVLMLGKQSLNDVRNNLGPLPRHDHAEISSS